MRSSTMPQLSLESDGTCKQPFCACVETSKSVPYPPTWETLPESVKADWRNFYEAHGYYTDNVKPWCLRGKPIRNLR